MIGPVGRPQWIAGALLLVFLGQCAWLVSRSLHTREMDLREWYRLDTGLRRWHSSPRSAAIPDPHSALAPGPPPRIRDNDGFDPDHSALWYLIASAPLLLWPGHFQSETLPYWGWLARIPYLAFGALLGASLWYVSRRLYGNEGGFIALTLYCFSPGVIRATWLGVTWQTFSMSAAYRELLVQLGQNSPALVLALPVALITYLRWPRARYFGNTAPLLVASLCLFLGFAAPHYQGLGFQLVALPFLFVFVSGIFADLLETKQRTLIMACITGLLLAYSFLSLSELARVGLARG